MDRIHHLIYKIFFVRDKYFDCMSTSMQSHQYNRHDYVHLLYVHVNAITATTIQQNTVNILLYNIIHKETVSVLFPVFVVPCFPSC